ncbi:MAG: hypothetical protein ACREM1_03045 [Longimicrobiales bacterium]
MKSAVVKRLSMFLSRCGTDVAEEIVLHARPKRAVLLIVRMTRGSGLRQWSIRTTGGKICLEFAWGMGDAYKVEIVDYHEE